jgi:hypothetical protein
MEPETNTNSRVRNTETSFDHIENSAHHDTINEEPEPSRNIGDLKVKSVLNEEEPSAQDTWHSNAKLDEKELSPTLIPSEFDKTLVHRKFNVHGSDSVKFNEAIIIEDDDKNMKPSESTIVIGSDDEIDMQIQNPVSTSFIYKQNYLGTEPDQMYLELNPYSSKDDLQSQINRIRMPSTNLMLNDNDEKGILQSIEEFYQEKIENYKICDCLYCQNMCLPFMVKNDIIDPSKLEEIHAKHSRYYFSFSNVAMNDTGSTLLSTLNNILCKTVNVHRAEIATTFQKSGNENKS